MKLHVVFVRHGESDANVQHVISNRDSRFELTARVYKTDKDHRP